MPDTRGGGPPLDPTPKSGRLPSEPLVKPKLKLETRIAKQAPPEDVDESLTPVQRVLERVGDVAILPQVARQVVEVTDRDDASIRNLEQTISIDPGLTARLLAQVNSAYYSLPKKTTSVKDALMFLGLKGVRELVMAVGVFEMFLGKTDQDSMRRRAWWRHSLDTAVFCRGIAANFTDLNPYEAYTCGLLHLLGKTFLDRYNPGEYARVQAVVDQGAPDVLAERAVFGCDHIEVEAEATRVWGFPELLTAGLDYFTPAPEPTPENALKACTGLGTRVVLLIEMKRPLDDVGPELFPGWILDALELTDNRLRHIVRSGIEALESSQAFSM